MIQITPMRPNLTYQNHFDGALSTFKMMPVISRVIDSRLPQGHYLLIRTFVVHPAHCCRIDFLHKP
jgi:hypothetical protein